MGADEEAVRRIVLVIRSRLFAWYKQRAEEHTGEDLTRLSDLTAKMIGSRHTQKCKTKAAETWGFALFLIMELEQHGERGPNDWQRLLQAGQAMESIVYTWQQSNWKVPDANVSDLEPRVRVYICLYTYIYVIIYIYIDTV